MAHPASRPWVSYIRVVGDFLGRVGAGVADETQELPMRLEPLYRVRFTYPESWSVGLDGGWQQMFFIAEGRCEGSVIGRFRGANFPRKEGADGPFRPDFQPAGAGASPGAGHPGPSCEDVVTRRGAEGARAVPLDRVTRPRRRGPRVNRRWAPRSARLRP